MVRENSRKFRTGERVRCLVTHDGEALIEGNIAYIHPENGWMSVTVDCVYTRAKIGNTGARYEFEKRKLPSPYPQTVWMSEAFRVSEPFPAGKAEMWEGVLKIAATA